MHERKNGSTNFSNIPQEVKNTGCSLQNSSILKIILWKI